MYKPMKIVFNDFMKTFRHLGYLAVCVALLSLSHYGAFAREYHVSVKGNDAGRGSEVAPFRTIQRAAEVAYAGDVITVHAGVYREWINPPRGG